MVAEERMETTMATTSEAELFRALPGWQRYGNRIEKTSTSTTSAPRRPRHYGVRSLGR